MGLRDDVQADIAEAFDSDLSDAVGAFRLTREIAGEYDPVTGGTETVREHFYGRGVCGSFSADEVDGQHIIQTDIKLTCLQNEITNESGDIGLPEVGLLLVNESGVNNWFRYFFNDYDDYRVVGVMKDAASVTWTIQLRKA
ncbi:hypothetical protein [Marinobacter nauticus]|uniref:Uncharacterized protein n=1 Tax=Marinobacter nauticus TaxID=2743 RepID=A0A1M2V0X2_MARNT|nr:hypothetical protein [Marinobacter nauticus]OJT01230.1 hypothetical protein BEE62_14875 [Marinobacter nauticus]